VIDTVGVASAGAAEPKTTPQSPTSNASRPTFFGIIFSPSFECERQCSPRDRRHHEPSSLGLQLNPITESLTEPLPWSCISSLQKPPTTFVSDDPLNYEEPLLGELDSSYV